MTVTCKTCGKLSPEGALCMHCGAFLLPPVACPGCNRNVAANVQKCQYCGTHIVPQKPVELIACPKCGKKMGAHLSACVMCGTPLPRRTAATAAPAAGAQAPGQPAQAARTGAATQGLDPLFIQAMRQGIGFLQTQKMTEGLAAAEVALQIIPGHPDALNLKGSCLHNLKRYAEALPCYEAALKQTPKEASLHFSMGNTLSLLQRMEEAAECYEQAYLLNPKDLNAAGNYALALRHLGRCGEAIAPAKLVLAMKPAPSIANCLGFCLFKQNRAEEALPYLKRAAEADPKQAGFWIDLGLCLESLQRQADADSCFSKALQANPMIARTNLHLARVLERGGKLEDAAEHYYRAAWGFTVEERNSKLPPVAAAEAQLARDGLKRLRSHAKRAPDCKPILSEAQQAEQNADWDQALALYEELAVWQPNDRAIAESLVRARKLRNEKEKPAAARPAAPATSAPAAQPSPPAAAAVPAPAAAAIDALPAMLEQALAQEKAGQKEQALESYSKFLSSVPLDQGKAIAFARERLEATVNALRPPIPKPAPTRASAELDKASALFRRGLLQEAIAAFDEAVEIDPQCAIAWANMGQCLVALGRPEDGLMSLDRAVKLFPQNSGMWLMRAGCLSGLDRDDEALACLNKALELDPWQSATWQNKGACLNALGRREEALTCLERALLLDPFNVIALHNAGMSAQALGRREPALAWLKRFLQIAPLVSGGDVQDHVETARKAVRELESGEKKKDEAVFVLPSKPVEVIGNYEIYKELGRGGFGVVYLAGRRDDKDVYALKTFLPEHAHDKAAIDLFKKEARTWIELDNHPHLVRAYYVDEINGRLYIAVEFILPGEDGQNTLEGYLKHKPPGVNQSLRWAIQFCYGMEYAYTRGLRCHRDIKPANIMIDWQKKLKISDFGLAGAVPRTSSSSGAGLKVRGSTVGLSMQTMEGGGAGTPTHMPPEQWRNSAACDERSDIYAFGVTLYQMAAKGRLPFMPPLPRDNSPAEQQRFIESLYQLHEAAPPPPVDSLLWPVIERCLQKDPRARFASFRDLRGELEPILKGQTQGEVEPAPKIEKLDAGTIVNKALSMESLNRLDEALRLFDEALALDERNAAALAGKGGCLERAGRHAEALQCFDRALAIDPNSDSAHNNRGNVFMVLEEYEKALACYTRAFELNPSNLSALRNNASALSRLGRVEAALACVNQAMGADTQSAASWSNKGDILRTLGRLKEAADCFKRAVELDPNALMAWQLQGECLLGLGAPAEALVCFEHVLELDAHRADTWTNRGNCLTAAGRLDDALASFEKAIELSPSTAAMAWNNKGDNFVRRKMFDKAMACFEQALQIDPKLELAIVNKGLRHRDAGRLDEAVACFERALSIDGASSNAWYYKADCHKRKSEYAPALQAFENVLRFEKNNRRAIGIALCNIGECFEKLGRVDDALGAFQKALEIIPGYNEAQQGLERCRAGGHGGKPPRKGFE